MHDLLLPFKSGNRHLVDRYGDLKEHNKKSKKLEEKLKAEIMKAADDAGTDSVGGDEYIARQEVRQRTGGLDAEALEKRFGKEAVDACRKPPTNPIVVTVTRREEDEE